MRRIRACGTLNACFESKRYMQAREILKTVRGRLSLRLLMPEACMKKMLGVILPVVSVLRYCVLFRSNDFSRLCFSPRLDYIILEKRQSVGYPVRFEASDEVMGSS